METVNLVRFASHPRPFLVEATYCDNPDCDCNEATLSFKEVTESGSSLENPLHFLTRVSLDTWLEVEPPAPRSPEVAAWIQEFLAHCSPARRGKYKSAYNDAKRVGRRKANYLISPDEVLAGTLLSYVNIGAEKSGLSAGGTIYTFDLDYQGREFLVEDCYCPNPKCNCKAIHLQFFEPVTSTDDRTYIYQRFLGKVTFAGRLSVEERSDCELAEASAVLTKFWQENARALKMLKDRYFEVKYIGRRSLSAKPTSSRLASNRTPSESGSEIILDNLRTDDDPPTTRTKVGRNMPCPCGSGKKYKKCCLPDVPNLNN